MTVAIDHVKKNSKGKFRTEYTIDCGWIDWWHADPDRADIKTIWASLPPQNGKNKPDLRIRSWDDKTEHSYWDVTVIFLDGTDEYKREHWFVRNVGLNNRTFYKKAALRLYEMSCEWVEEEQSFLSSWHMEDLVSNLMAFYGHVDNLNREAIIEKEKCGGWTDKNTANKKSLEIFQLLVDHYDYHAPRFDQPKAEGKGFRQAYLYNKVLPAQITNDKRFGWNLLPKFFWNDLPLPRLDGDTNGSDILSPGTALRLLFTHKILASNTSNQNYFLNQQEARSISTGTRVAKIPGPLGSDPFA